MRADQSDVSTSGNATEGDPRGVDVEFVGAVGGDGLQRSEGVLDTNGECVFWDESIGDVDDADVGFDTDVLADVGFGVEVTQTPAYVTESIIKISAVCSLIMISLPPP